MNTGITLNDTSDSSIRSEKLRFILVLLFVFSLPFDRFYSTVLLMLLIICTFIDISYSKFKAIPKQIWIFQIIFFLGCLGYLYSFDKHEAGFLLERQLAILAFPLILPLAIQFNQQRIHYVLIALALGCVLSTLYLFLNILNIVIYGNLSLSSVFSKEFFNHGFSAPLNIHAGYLSTFVAFSIIFLVKQIVTEKRVFHRLFSFISLPLLTAGLFFLASRNTIISTVLVICFIFPLFFVKRKLLFFSIITVLLSGSFYVFSKINYLNERFSSDIITDINSSASEYNFEGAEPRIERWKGAMELIKKSPLIGYGTGDEILVLKTKYVEKELFISYLESFNAHNEYLSFMLKNGIIGLLIFLAALIYYLRLAIKNKNFMYVSFLILMIIGFFTENILDANKGIYFFAFFNTFLGYTVLRSSQTELRH
jgi:O-antigen ligase